jgi:hypothetical protein
VATHPYTRTMPNFVTFDDGMSYIAISQIESFGIDKTDESRRTLFVLKDGRKIHMSRPVSECAEMLSSVNLWY